jgi:hypothetical protein
MIVYIDTEKLNYYQKYNYYDPPVGVDPLKK